MLILYVLDFLEYDLMSCCIQISKDDMKYKYTFSPNQYCSTCNGVLSLVMIAIYMYMYLWYVPEGVFSVRMKYVHTINKLYLNSSPGIPGSVGLPPVAMSVWVPEYFLPATMTPPSSVNSAWPVICSTAD